MSAQAIDPIELELLRSRLETIAEQTSLAVEHTAVSTVVTESRDYSVTLCDADGALVIGAGMVRSHFGAAVHAVRSTIERHGDTIADGDVFIANDPHDGGGLHPQDVMVQRPIYAHGERIGWVGISAHMMDVGGMAPGSFAPEATECYQEALRLPPVRLFRRGEEVTEVWDIMRTNVRMSELVEMDMRGLVAGAHFANERLAPVVAEMGPEPFRAGLGAIRDLTAAEMRRRIGQLADGTYRWTSWTEFDQDFYEIPCTLTVDGERLIFDFEGAAPQTDHYFNSKPYIVASNLGLSIAALLARDLPYNDGVLSSFEVRCPVGSIVNSKPPAPIAAAHMHVGMNAAGVATAALQLAIAASPPDLDAHRYLAGTGGSSAIGNQIWVWPQQEGSTDAFFVIDGSWVGSPAGAGHDGLDLVINGSDLGGPGNFVDIEVLESWYPLLYLERRARPGSGGAGQHRAGGGNQFSFRTHGIPAMDGILFGMRRWLPLQGVAGGRPGACAEFVLHSADGSSEVLDVNRSGVRVEDSDWYQIRLPSGGGYGDPLERDPELVRADIADGRFDDAEAAAVYGVHRDASGAVDAVATSAARATIRADRLDRARPAAKPVPPGIETADGADLPLYPGVVQRGNVALAEASGAALAVAPDHWTDGCPVLVEDLWGGTGPEVEVRTYLDPSTGQSLHVEVALAGHPRSFLVNPRRWSEATAGTVGR